MQNKNIIHVQNLTVKYHSTLALENISLSVPSNIRAAIVGPNGAGKSTLIKAMLNLIPSQYSQISFFNAQNIEQVRHRIAYVPQRSEVNWNFPTTVIDVVTMGIHANRFIFQKMNSESTDRIEYSLERMNLEDLSDRQINQLSGGQKQRVFLARAIAQNADLYLFDEPLAGVDMHSEQIIMDQIKQFQAEGKTSLTVHHDLNTVPEYFDSVILLNKQLIAAGLMEDVFTQELIEKTYAQTQSVNKKLIQSQQHLSSGCYAR